MESLRSPHSWALYDGRKMRDILFVLLLMFVSISHAETWRPDPMFKLETSDYMQTLTWISGVSYALTQSKLELEAQKKRFFICNSPSIIGSKELMGILNKKHKGQTITSEQAISTIINELKVAYPCS